MEENHLDACPALVTEIWEDCSCEKEESHYLLLAKRVLILSVIELVGGFLSGSMALTSEGIHQLLDGTESIISAIVSRTARKSRNEKKLRRIGGIISALLLLFAAAWIIFEGAERIFTPQAVKWYMLPVVILGFVVTFLQRTIHGDALDEHKNLTHFWQDSHLLSDLFANGVIIVSGMVMLITGGLYWIDGIISICIGVLIFLFVGIRFFSSSLYDDTI